MLPSAGTAICGFWARTLPDSAMPTRGRLDGNRHWHGYEVSSGGLGRARGIGEAIIVPRPQAGHRLGSIPVRRLR